jgi:hypothetical protein
MLSAANGIVALLMIAVFPVRYLYNSAIIFLTDRPLAPIEQELVHLPVG